MKASDDLLDRVLPAFAPELGLDPLRKADYSDLVPHIPEDRISNEVTEVLDLIQQVALRTRPAG